jgi:hypothetical protein
MHGIPEATPIILTEAERTELEALARSPKTEYRLRGLCWWRPRAWPAVRLAERLAAARPVRHRNGACATPPIDGPALMRPAIAERNRNTRPTDTAFRSTFRPLSRPRHHPTTTTGLTFNSPDGRAEIRAYYGHLLSDGENLVDDERETERYSAEDHLHVTYRQATAHNFTMSGLKGDHIIYVRAVATCKGIAAATLWVEYPQSAKPQLDPLIAHMAKTLIGSNACWAPG